MHCGLAWSLLHLLTAASGPVLGCWVHQEYLKRPVRVKVGRVSSPTANVTQTLEKVAEKDKARDPLHLKLVLLLPASSAAKPLFA